jgi:hypothetical protein
MAGPTLANKVKADSLAYKQNVVDPEVDDKTADSLAQLNSNPFTRGAVSKEDMRSSIAEGVRPDRDDPSYGFQSILDQDGHLSNQYAVKPGADVKFNQLNHYDPITMKSNMGELDDRLSGINLNTQGLEAIRDRALSSGPSSWASLMLQQQDQQKAAAQDKLAETNATQGAQARSQMAMKGGLQGGASERMARQNARDLMLGQQELGRDDASKRLGIMTTDESQKLDLLKGLPGMEAQALEPDLKKAGMWQSMAQSEQANQLNTDFRNQQSMFDVDKFNTQSQLDLDLKNRDYTTGLDKYNNDSSIKGMDSINAYNQNKYNQDMAGWAANRQAQAIENSGKH